MQKANIKDVDLTGKKVIVRVDFNVPVKEGKITDDNRIRQTLNTIKYLLDKNCKVILMSHMGRPDGKPVDKYRLDLVGERLSELLGLKVKKLNDSIGDEVKKEIENMKEKEVVLLENLRFYGEEEKNDPEFAKKLAGLADVYVNDAFGTAHRAHASTEGIAKYLPAVGGFLMEKELNYLGDAVENPERPFYAILGGAKVSDKIKVIENLINKVDGIIIGGGMAFTFLKSKGYEIGKSLLDPNLDFAKELMKKAENKGIKFLLPVDVVCAYGIDKVVDTKIMNADEIPADMMGVDIGPKTIELFNNVLKDAKTVIWNGPMGVFEVKEFAKGTKEVAELLAGLDATTIIGGGDSAACIAELGLSDKVSHVSTGGGASLEFLEGRVLPGVAALMDKDKAKV